MIDGLSGSVILQRTNDLNNEYQISNPFDKPFIDNYCSENEAKIYLTRDDIRDLGFLRSDPNKFIYKHKDKPFLYLIEIYYHNYSVKDIIDRKVLVWSDKNDGQQQQLYQSTKPNKVDIQKIINNYAA